MGTTPDVSVVIPVYNKGPYLAECIESVLAQRQVSLEVICVDDCSTDGSWEILQRLCRSDGRLRLIRQKANLGPAPARNAGIALASGRFLQFTDADDLLPAGALHSLHAASVETRAEVVRGVLETIGDGVRAWWTAEVDGEILPHSWTLPEVQRPAHTRIGSLLDLPELWIPWWFQSCLISRELVLRHGIQFPPLIRGQDPPFLAEVMCRAPAICVIPDVTYTYRLVEHASTSGPRVVEDQFKHAELVKEVYGDAHAACWRVYKDFIKRDLTLSLEHANLKDDQLASFARRLDAL